MNNAFFLTPQIANLMEDFVREIRRGSSLFLLYGEEGVGKSRLLRKLVADRLTSQKVHFIDFDAETQNNSSEYVKQTAAVAAEADIIIFDHFDAASNKSQQQIFDSWATDGQDRSLNFIVCANSTGLGRFRQLAQHFQLEAKSFQLLPFDLVVSEAYLQYLLYPDYPFARLILPGPVKRLLRQSKGYFYRIKEIADQHGALIEIKHEPESGSSLMPFAIIFGLIVVIAAAGYIFHSTWSWPATEPLIVQSREDSNPALPEPGTDAELVRESVLEPVSPPKSVVEPKPEQEPMQAPQAPAESAISPVTETLSESDWFDQRLKFSKDWARGSASDRGTIQIMSIEFSRFNSDSFQAYLDGLKEEGLDISKLLIFETQLGGREFYSIMYGDYQDRQEARRQLSLLPDILRTENPIPRSAGSILDGMPVSTEN